MGNNKVFRFRLPTACIKLGTLRDSCSSILKTQTYPPSFTWFGGAAAICQEAIDYIKEILLAFEQVEKKLHPDHRDKE